MYSTFSGTTSIVESVGSFFSQRSVTPGNSGNVPTPTSDTSLIQPIQKPIHLVRALPTQRKVRQEVRERPEHAQH